MKKRLEAMENDIVDNFKSYEEGGGDSKTLVPKKKRRKKNSREKKIKECRTLKHTSHLNKIFFQEGSFCLFFFKAIIFASVTTL